MQKGISRASRRRTGAKPSPRSASVVGQRQTRAPAWAIELELTVVGVSRMDDRRSGAEAARLGQQLDRSQPVLGDTLLDLARLLAGVDV